jgi:hypothetical protein
LIGTVIAFDYKYYSSDYKQQKSAFQAIAEKKGFMNHVYYKSVGK